MRGSAVYIPSTSVYISQRSAFRAAARAKAGGADDLQAVAGLRAAGDAVVDVANAVGVGNGGAAVLLDDEGHLSSLYQLRAPLRGGGDERLCGHVAAGGGRRA